MRFFLLPTQLISAKFHFLLTLPANLAKISPGIHPGISFESSSRSYSRRDFLWYCFRDSSRTLLEIPPGIIVLISSGNSLRIPPGLYKCPRGFHQEFLAELLQTFLPVFLNWFLSGFFSRFPRNPFGIITPSYSIALSWVFSRDSFRDIFRQSIWDSFIIETFRDSYRGCSQDRFQIRSWIIPEIS